MAVKTAPKVVIPERRINYLFDFDGHLGMLFDTLLDKTEPVRRFRYLRADRILVRDWPDVVGLHWTGSTTNQPGWLGSVLRPGAWNATTVDLTGAPIVELREPIPAPRDGKEYTWRWDASHASYNYGDGWVKENFPRCPECDKWHNPAFTYCDEHDVCHAPRKQPCPRRFFTRTGRTYLAQPLDLWGCRAEGSCEHCQSEITTPFHYRATGQDGSTYTLCAACASPYLA